ncbi:MAG: hypothetical protein KKA42_03680, partial [candidate division Zixibacteria bacterium]|nr:hypothetical protein [candidate division Zixibacteria bacterium]
MRLAAWSGYDGFVAKLNHVSFFVKDAAIKLTVVTFIVGPGTYLRRGQSIARFGGNPASSSSGLSFIDTVEAHG